jgi:hypothetical protein
LPEEYLRQHPREAESLRGAVEAAWQLHLIRLEPRPLPEDVRRRIDRRVLLPLLRRAAEKRRAGIERSRGAAGRPPAERSDLLLLLLQVAGRTGRESEPVRGMIRLMKLVFLAQQYLGRLLAPELPAYEFVPYRFGPLAPELYDDLQVSIWAGLVRRTEYDPDGLPVTNCDDYGRMEEISFAGANARFELTPDGAAHARALATELERTNPALLQDLRSLKDRLSRMTWQQIIVHVYERFPQYTGESELLDQLRAVTDDA